jgi:hypothetical protein
VVSFNCEDAARSWLWIVCFSWFEEGLGITCNFS